MFKLEIDGRPVPKAYGRSGKRYYRKPKVRAQEKLIGDLWTIHYPEIYYKEEIAFGLIACVSDKRTGDLKNYFYLAEDALTKVAFDDDKQIKYYLPSAVILSEKERTILFLVRKSHPELFEFTKSISNWIIDKSNN